MKKAVCAVLGLLFALSSSACGVSAAMETSVAAETPSIVVFSDPVLEAKVRDAMGKPEGDITVSAAEAVTELLLGNDSPERLTEDDIITDLGGLEYFTGVTNLELTFNGIINIGALSGMTGLKRLCLGNNLVCDISPISRLDLEELQVWGNDYLTDISPISGMGHLKVLMIGGCPVTDISAVAGMKELSILDMTNCKVSDISALEGLPLRKLYLSGNQIKDYTPIADIYNSLEDKDFTAPFTLRDLGFSWVDNGVMAGYKTETMAVTINHDKWGAPAMELENNSVKMYFQMDGGYELIVIYYPEIDVYVFQMSKNNQMKMNYIYDPAKGGFTLSSSDRKSAEQVLKDALGKTDSDDILLAPIPIFNDALKNTFGITADALYALPFAPPTLLNLGFTADEANAVCVYEQREGRYVTIEVHRPELGEKDYDVRFFTPLSDEYRIVVTYCIDERKFIVKGDDNDEGGAAFEYFIDTSEHVDVWCSNNIMTVEEYFINAYNDSGIKDIYLHSVQLMENYISDTFGMSIEDLYALPVGE